ncbi:ABC transporter ATP-binding protein [Patescibacteria group bacterium]|nr:ABC transporter ATP-binding protein [Patescibacteria group bacterium]
MDNTQPLIVIERLSKAYDTDGGSTPVLRGVSLTINRGEFVAIMGPSGSGKSTLMHILGFLDVPTSGKYFFSGHDVSTLDEAQLALMRRTQVGFVFQAFFLLPKFTVLENVMLPLIYRGVSVKERTEQAMIAVANVGLSHRAHFRTTKLSGGEKQRVAIARALVANPSVIFADEPTGNLDSTSGAQVMELLRQLHEVGHTVILVTHETTTAQFARRIIRVRDGELVGDEQVVKQSSVEQYAK